MDVIEIQYYRIVLSTTDALPTKFSNELSPFAEPPLYHPVMKDLTILAVPLSRPGFVPLTGFRQD